jgi:hypothetical protein
MNAAYPSVRRVSCAPAQYVPHSTKTASPKTKALPRSDGPGTPREKGSSFRGVLLARSRVLGLCAHGCWTGAMQTSENTIHAMCAEHLSLSLGE